MNEKKILLDITTKTERGGDGSFAVSCDKRGCFIFR